MSLRTLAVIFTLASSSLPTALLAGCSTGSSGSDCSSDLDCGARVCVDGACVECASNGDCEAQRFCCQGICRPDDEVADRCGCSPSPTGSPGSMCTDERDDALCLVDDAVASTVNVDEGACGCGCTPALGGPICGPPEEAGGSPICGCAVNDECRGASLGGDQRPHEVANTCAPDSTCVCLTTSGPAAACDAQGATPDCSFGDGCRALLSDVAHCGVGGRVCTDPATGIVDTGACLAGGCACDDLADCTGDDLNVNSCAFVVPGEGSRCVCGGYSRGGLQSACPMELACEEGGCVKDGVVYRTEESLLGALGLAAPTP